MHTEQLMNAAKTAVTAAAQVTRKIQDQVRKLSSINKEDHSPVTIADFAAQAIVCHLLNQLTPTIPIVAEETSLVLQNLAGDSTTTAILNIMKDHGFGSIFANSDTLYEKIDLGGHEPGQRFWTLDPIDGTKGFLRGEQFAIALALIEEGRVILGVTGCPRLSFSHDPSHEGYLFMAASDGPCQRQNLQTGQMAIVQISNQTQTSAMRFVQSYESAHGNLPLQHRIAKELGILQHPVQMDSQVKYGIVASGQAEVYVRIPSPNRPNYREKIWDHAAGSILVERAGGLVTDARGKRLDFGQGKTLKKNRGIIAAVPQVHSRIVTIIEGFDSLMSACL